ncbi:hypothetical protein [Duganella sp. BuS-21]|uniref:hypothetical protein n=1 Tax=Duganella sp. BuS-21 TaxID=2943848 RepID=UPI0035A5C610
MLFYQLFRPFAYIFIRHPVKRKVDWYLPIGLTLISLILIWPMREDMNVWAGSGLVASAQGFVQGLPGFYIAALAAVATFGQQTGLDRIVPAPTPTLHTNYSGQWVDMKLTRRRFLCLLFAYLTALSIALSLFAYYAQAIALPARKLFIGSVVDAVSAIALAVYVLFLFQLFVITLWGLYYLADKMHEPDPYNTPVP